MYCSRYWRSPGTGRLITGELLSQVSSPGSEKRIIVCVFCVLSSSWLLVTRSCSRLTQPLPELTEETSLLWSEVGQAITVARYILVCRDVVLTVLAPHSAGRAPLPPPHRPARRRSGAPVLRCDLNIQDESLTAGLV